MREINKLNARVFNIIAEKITCIVPNLDPGSISIDNKMEDYGCNSIDRTDIVWMVQEELGLIIPVTEFAGVYDLRSLTELMVRYMEVR